MNNHDLEKLILTVSTPLPGNSPKTRTYTLTVKQKFEGKSILDFYCENQPQKDKNYWLAKIISGNLTVNKQKITPNFILKAGQMTEHSALCEPEPTVSNKINILYQDSDLLIINKPSPLAVHPCGRFHLNTLTHFLNLAFPEEKLNLIHRLDANTTGIVVFGKTLIATQFLSKQFENSSIQKEYITIVEGILNEDHFSSNSTIGKNQKQSGSREISPTGTEAFTQFKVLSRNIEKQKTVLHVLPKTGRTNQIRLHLAHINHPILGDLGYADKKYFEHNPMTYPEDTLYLHAWKLTFIHPTTLLEIKIVAPIPEKFNPYFE